MLRQCGNMHVGLIGTGEMGGGVGAWLVKNGATVVTSLAGRSAVSSERIRAAGIGVAETPADVSRSASIVLSIVPPDQAVRVARAFVAMLVPNEVPPAYADCNAISPDTSAEIGKMMDDAGVHYVDGGIIGGPPREGYGPKIYASGPHVAELEKLIPYGLNIIKLEGPIGIASALKMSYAGMTKGIAALGAAMFACSEIGGVGNALRAEFAASQPELNAFLKRQLPTIDAKAYRWVAEMREIGKFGAAEPGVTGVYDAIAEFYVAIAESAQVKGVA